MPRNMKAPEKAQNTGATLKRVIAYVMEHYKIHYAVVVVCIIFSTLVSLVGTLAMRTLIDDYIVPLTKQAVPDYNPLARIMFVLMGVLLLGVAASYLYNRIMITVSQGTMKRLRIELFTGMEELPISYFDTHAHGDIMSVYTNDVDTLRQVISQTIPQFISSTISLIDLSRSLSSTPKRCSSSITTSPRSLKRTPSERMPCVPTSTSTVPSAAPRSAAARSDGVAKRECSAIVSGYGAKRSRKLSKCCCARTVVGTSTATCLPCMAAVKAARSATSVLP